MFSSCRGGVHCSFGNDLIIDLTVGLIDDGVSIAVWVSVGPVR